MADRTMTYAFIDIEGLSLSREEHELLEHPVVAGVVLFSRNYESPKQLTALTQAIYKAKPNILIAVDQEGGRVQRFREHFTTLPSMQYWGDYYNLRPKQALQKLTQMTTTMVQELQQVGVKISFAPVLDINHELSEIIGERSFGRDPYKVAKLAAAVIFAMQKISMPAVGKHFPGHGAVVLDSHKALPVDAREQKEIFTCDLIPFAQLSLHLDAVMTAHIVYPSCDEKLVTFSNWWLEEILRDRLQFTGAIISDDLSMQAAAEIAETHIDRVGLALEAGCDLVIVCNAREAVIKVLDAFEHYRPRRSQPDRVRALKHKSHPHLPS